MNFCQARREEHLADGATYICQMAESSAIVVHVEQIDADIDIDIDGIVITHGKVLAGKEHFVDKIDKVEVLVTAKRFTRDQLTEVLDLVLCYKAPATVEFDCKLDDICVIQHLVSFIDGIYGVGKCDLQVERYKGEKE